MLFAAPIMRAVGLPVLQVIGWVFSALQAGLAVEVLIGAVRRLTLAIAASVLLSGTATAQELDPRAFAPAPIGTTIVLTGVGGSKDGILFDPSVDVADVAADLHIVTTGFGYTFALAGRQARVLAVFPVAWGSIAGAVGGQPQRQDLRGLADPNQWFNHVERIVGELTGPRRWSTSATSTSTTSLTSWPWTEQSEHRDVLGDEGLRCRRDRHRPPVAAAWLPSGFPHLLRQVQLRAGFWAHPRGH
jgi:hypothetical protein